MGADRSEVSTLRREKLGLESMVAELTKENREQRTFIEKAEAECRAAQDELMAATAPEVTEKALEEATRRMAELESQLEVERAEKAKVKEQNHQLVRQYQDRVDVLAQMSERCTKQEAEVKKAKENTKRAKREVMKKAKTWMDFSWRRK